MLRCLEASLKQELQAFQPAGGVGACVWRSHARRQGQVGSGQAVQQQMRMKAW
jgi:hypothetical protein